MCGKEIIESDDSGDHAFPKTLLKREQPKAKGYDYGGKLPTHETCNNTFGPERFVRKAIELLQILNNPDSYSTFQNVKHPDIEIMVIDSTFLSDLSEQEKEFFKINDVRNEKYSDWTDPETIRRHEKINPFLIPWNTALSVLAKSAAAILVKRHNIAPENTPWRILAILNYTEDENIDLSKQFGKVKPFDEGIELYIKLFEKSRDYFVVFRYESLIVYLFFAFESGYKNIRLIKKIFSGQNLLLFEKDTLLELKDFMWLEHDISKIELPNSF
ncbi:MAG: hypothetical protein ACE5GV_18360 [Candidatus Scalindua sp.]